MMPNTTRIPISKKTRKLLNKIKDLDGFAAIGNEFEQDDLDRQFLIQWLNAKYDIDKANEFQLRSLQASLLNDLYTATLSAPPKKEKSNVDWTTQLKFFFLAVAGAIYWGCQGFDGIATLLSATSLSPFAIFVLGMGFSILSIAVFCGLSLVEISQSLGVKLSNTPKLIDVYLREYTAIKGLMKAIENDLIIQNNSNLQEDLLHIQEQIHLVNMLKERYSVLRACESLDEIFNNPELQLARTFASIGAGIIFFSGGFFVGKTVSLAVAGLFFTAVNPLSILIVLPSFIVAAAALSIYWFSERPGIENLVGRWFGLDKEKIEQLSNSDDMTKIDSKLNMLSQALVGREAAIKENILWKKQAEFSPQRQENPQFQSGQSKAMPSAKNFMAFSSLYTNPSSTPTPVPANIDLESDLNTNCGMGQNG